MEHLKAEEQLLFPTVTTAAVVTPVQTPLKLLNSHQQPEQQQKQQPPPPTQQERANKIKIHKCGFCTFQSKELGNVRFLMRKHMNKKVPEKLIINQAAKALTLVPQQKKRHYRCQVCSKFFDSRINCLDHIQKNHYQPTRSTLNGERETEDSCLVTTQVKKTRTIHPRLKKIISKRSLLWT